MLACLLAHEQGAGDITVMTPGTLRLQQTKFRNRVLGAKSTVELRFNDGQEPQKYVATGRSGRQVTLLSSDHASASASGKCLPVSHHHRPHQFFHG